MRLRLRALFDHISISNTLYLIVPCIALPHLAIFLSTVKFIEGGSLVVPTFDCALNVCHTEGEIKIRYFVISSIALNFALCIHGRRLKIASVVCK